MRTWTMPIASGAALIGLAAVTVGCGVRDIGPASGAAPTTRSYAEARAYLLTTLDTVKVEGRGSMEDRSPVPGGAMIAAASHLRFDRRLVGQDWGQDERNEFVVRDTVTMSERGEYRFTLVALCEDRITAEVAYVDEAGKRGFVRFAEFGGISLSAGAGGARADDLTIRRAQRENRFDFTLRYPRDRRYVTVDDAEVRREPASGAGVAGALEFGTPVSRLRSEEGWERVMYGMAQYGWMRSEELGEADELARVREARDAAWAREIDRRGFPPELARALKERRVTEGMTGEMVTMAWGEPDRREEVVSEGGERERWLYLPRGGTASRQVILSGERVIRVMED